MSIGPGALPDPLAKEIAPSPYQMLADAGIGYRSSIREVLDASYGLLEMGPMAPDVRAAWDALRQPRKRLLFDLLLYPFNPESELSSELERLDRELADWGPPPSLASGVDALRALASDMESIFGPIEIEEVDLGFSPASLPPTRIVPEVPEFDR